MNRVFLAAALALLPAAAGAQYDREQPGQVDPLRDLELLELADENLALPAVEFEPRQKFLFGADGYRSGETDLFVLLPLDFSAGANYSWYKSDFTSMTHTLSFSGGKEWDSKFIGATYAITPWANDYRADSMNVKVSMRSGSRDFRTTLGADVTVTHHTQMIRIGGANAHSLRYDVTQRSPNISVRQQLWNTRLSVDLSESTYNKDLLIASLNIAVATLRYPTIATNFGNASGLTQGFQDRSMRFGVSHDFKVGKLPFTAWGSYNNIHFVDTFQAPDDVSLVFVRGQTADSQSYGLDCELTSVVNASVQYQHIRQTNYPTRDYWGFAFGLRL